VKNIVIIIIALTTGLISGCGAMPLTADEFRLAVPGARTAKVETFEVNRPFSAVAKTFNKKAPECLNKTVTTTSTTPGKYGPISSTYTVTYKPTVLITKNKAELHVQHHTDNAMKVYEEPEGGYFLLVADAYPIDEKRTQVDLYRPSIGHKVLIKAVKGWSTGKNVGCPDLTQ
jgi:hypothetical protein